MKIKSGSCVVVDVGQEISVASSLFLANLVAQELHGNVYFVIRRKFSAYAEQFPRIQFLYVEDREFADVLDTAYSVVDFTIPGEGLSLITDQAAWIHRFHLSDKEASSQNLLNLKAEFIDEHFGLDKILKNVTESLKNKTGMLTYSATTAAYLNMLGVPTIEMCFRYKTPGSFLPGSLVIKGDSFSLLHREDLDLIFKFYKENKIEDLFVNKSILQIEWDLVYFKADEKTGTVYGKNYPVTPMEAFIDLFLKNFLVIQHTVTMDDLMKSVQKIDHIDLEMTMAFIKKTLKRCLDDVEYECFPFTESYWNFVRPYVDCTSRRSLTPLHRSLTQALMGLEMFEKIMQRQRKTLSMH